MTIEEFCEKHNACKEGRAWALEECQTMQDVWDKACPEWLVWVATRQGVLDARMLRLFACWCVRYVWHLLSDERSRKAVEVAERFAVGNATKQELDEANLASLAAYKDADLDKAAAADKAALDAAWDICDAARAANFVTWCLARDAAHFASSAVIAAGGLPVSRHNQAAWLRANTKPTF